MGNHHKMYPIDTQLKKKIISSFDAYGAGLRKKRWRGNTAIGLLFVKFL